MAAFGRIKVNVSLDEERTIIEAFSGIASQYEDVVDDELQRFWGWRYSDFIERFLESTSITDQDRVLDLATGTGVIPLRLSEQRNNGNPIYGLDITYAMLARARGHQGRKNGSVALTCASALEMPFHRASFDVILCGLATHHMDAAALIDEARRVLKPDGRLNIADVAVPPLYRHPLINPLLKALTYLYFTAREGFARGKAEGKAVSNVRTPEEWRALLAENDFIEISILEFAANRSLMPGLMIIRARKKPAEEPYEHSH